MANRTQSCSIADITLDAPSDGASYRIPAGSDKVEVTLIATINGCPDETKSLEIVFAAAGQSGWKIAGIGSYTGTEARYQLPITVTFNRSEVENLGIKNGNNYVLAYGWTARGASDSRSLGYQSPIPQFVITAENS
ncbi:MAG: hypothetical protein WCI63_04350, partial [bacterium]